MRRQNAVVINSRRNLSQLVRNYQKGSPPVSIKFQRYLIVTAAKSNEVIISLLGGSQLKLSRFTLTP